MADIVLSYAREDRGHAESLARALEHAGWSVWWDRAILPGESYEQVIEAELSTARCVVVLWSAAARQSNWVRDEATLALSRHVLVSVVIDASEPPLGFRQQQTANLAQWTGSAGDPAFVLLTQGIANLLDDAAPGGRVSQMPPAVPRAQHLSRRAMLIAVGCVLAIGGAVAWWTRGRVDRRASPSADAAPVSQEPARTPSSQALIVPARASVTLVRENVTLSILSGRLEPLNADTRVLVLHIRFANNGTQSFYRTYYTNLRLLIDGVLRAPTDAPLAQVEASSAGEFDYRFDVPVATTRVVLRVMHGDQTSDIPLDVATPP